MQEIIKTIFLEMNNDELSLPSFELFLAVSAVLFTGLLYSVCLALEEEELIENTQVAAELIASSLVLFRRKRQSAMDGNGRVVRRRYIQWDRERARMCINQDYLGAMPSFCLDDFKRIFRVSRSSYDSIRNYLGGNNIFFRDGVDVTGRVRVSADAKILISLKYLAYGCSVNAFRDYFQLGESTAMLCVKKFTNCIANSEFQRTFFSFFTPSDARRVEALHYQRHGIHGMIGSLDCSHFVWGNCPVAHHGQYQGKEGRPTIIVEALADYNLFAWHAVFGYSGTLNDISVWDSSSLLQSLCDGSFAELDFTFSIGNEVFDELWMLVDGIYPSLARFVKPISVPIGTREALFSMWQESKRKDIERFFGVFKRKFHFFNKPIPFAFMDEIISAFYCCIILHNMAVTERINSQDDEVENHIFYDCVLPQTEHVMAQRSQLENVAIQLVNHEAENVRQRHLEIEYLAALGINVLDCTLEVDTARMEVLPALERMAQVRWNHLYDVRRHKKLTAAITRELKDQYNRYKKGKEQL